MKRESKKECPWMLFSEIVNNEEKTRHSDCIHTDIKNKQKCLYCLLNIIAVKIERLAKLPSL